MAGRAWTASEKARLARAAGAGDPAEEIAAALGRTAGAVRRCAERLGVPLSGGFHKLDAGQRSAVVGFLAAHPGATLADCARACGRTRATVRAMAARLASEGLLVRTGGATKSCRYRVRGRWGCGAGG